MLEAAVPKPTNPLFVLYLQFFDFTELSHFSRTVETCRQTPEALALNKKTFWFSFALSTKTAEKKNTQQGCGCVCLCWPSYSNGFSRMLLNGFNEEQSQELNIFLCKWDAVSEFT